MTLNNNNNNKCIYVHKIFDMYSSYYLTFDRALAWNGDYTCACGAAGWIVDVSDSGEMSHG